MAITQSELKNIIANLAAVEPESIKDNTMLIGELKLNSIKIVELLAILGEEHGMHVTEQDAVHFNTFKDLYDFTQKQSS